MTGDSRADLVTVRVLEAAVEEFERVGEVKTVRCNECEGLISVRRVGQWGESYSLECECGRFNSTLRGV